MTSNNLHEKIAFILSFLILNNYLFLSLSFFPILIKINFIFFLGVVVYFYFKNFRENLFLKIFFLFIIFISLGNTIGDGQYPAAAWDPRTIWFFHAKRIFYDLSIFSIADNYAIFSHNEYPNLVPAFASALALLVGHWNEVFPKLAFPLMFLPPMILMYSFLKSTHYLIFLSIVFFTIGNYLFNGWADGLVAMYFGSSAFLMYLLFIVENNFYRNRSFFYLLAICFFTTLTLIKNEGFVLLLILFLTTFLIKFYKGEANKNIGKFALLLISFLPIVLWKYFCYSKGVNSGDIQIFNAGILSNLLPRLDDLNNYKLISYFLLLNEKFIITLSFFLISFWFRRNRELFSFVIIATMMYIVTLFLIYLSTPIDFHFQLDSTATRVIKSLTFFLAFFGLCNLTFYKFKR